MVQNSLHMFQKKCSHHSGIPRSPFAALLGSEAKVGKIVLSEVKVGDNVTIPIPRLVC